jgi:nicotinamide riboside kinase
VHKIAIVGPESSGKTTLAMALGEHFHVPVVPEHARAFLELSGPGYAEDDLLRIARGQVLLEERIMADRRELLICDTDLVTIRIWSEEKYRRCDPWILEQSVKRHYDLWLLCSPEGIGWEPDPLRENPNDRERLFKIYQDLLGRLRLPFAVMLGNREKRLADALVSIASIGREGGDT